MDHTITLTSSGVARTAILHLPPLPSAAGDTRSVALVANLHTLAEGAAQEERLTGMSALADAEGFAVVYPDGLLAGNFEPWLPLGVGKSWNGGACCPKACSKGVSDVQFMRDLVPFAAEAVGNLTAGALRVDRRRVYATGMSYGGLFSYQIALSLPRTFAAVAPVAGGVLKGFATQPAGPAAGGYIGVLDVHGWCKR